MLGTKKKKKNKKTIPIINHNDPLQNVSDAVLLSFLSLDNAMWSTLTSYIKNPAGDSTGSTILWDVQSGWYTTSTCEIITNNGEVIQSWRMFMSLTNSFSVHLENIKTVLCGTDLHLMCCSATEGIKKEKSEGLGRDAEDSHLFPFTVFPLSSSSLSSLATVQLIRLLWQPQHPFVSVQSCVCVPVFVCVCTRGPITITQW